MSGTGSSRSSFDAEDTDDVSVKMEMSETPSPPYSPSSRVPVGDSEGFMALSNGLFPFMETSTGPDESESWTAINRNTTSPSSQMTAHGTDIGDTENSLFLSMAPHGTPSTFPRNLPPKARARLQAGFVLDENAPLRTPMNPDNLRLRLPEELAALATPEQEENRGSDIIGMPLSSFLTKTKPSDLDFWRLQPNISAIDWRNGKEQKIKSRLRGRAAQGHLIGITIPRGQQCSCCAKGDGAFESCRVVYLENGTFAWNGTCSSCAYLRDQKACSNRFDLFGRAACEGNNPSEWVLNLFHDLNPQMPGLDKARTELLRHGKKSSKTRHSTGSKSHRKRAATGPPEAKGSKRRSLAGPETLFRKTVAKLKAEHDTSEKEKKRQSRASSGSTEAYGILGSVKMVRKSKRGPEYDGNWYHSPLDASGVRKLEKTCSDKEKHQLREAYRSLLSVNARVESDIGEFFKFLRARDAVDFDWDPDEVSEDGSNGTKDTSVLVLDEDYDDAD